MRNVRILRATLVLSVILMTFSTMIESAVATGHDSDYDGYSDTEEAEAGTNPNDPKNKPGGDWNPGDGPINPPPQPDLEPNPPPDDTTDQTGGGQPDADSGSGGIIETFLGWVKGGVCELVGVMGCVNPFKEYARPSTEGYNLPRRHPRN